MDKKLKIGLNTFDTHVIENRPDFELPLENGLDFIFCHFDEGLENSEAECEKAAKVAQILKDKGLEFIANFEFQNFAPVTVSGDGFDWSNHPDGTHRLNLRPEVVTALKSKGNLIGISYDEFEHTIINRNISLWLDSKLKIDKPVFKQLDTKDAVRQGEALSDDLKKFADHIKELGAPMFSGEHVFPVLYHTFARNGITPNFKSQKESMSNIQYAIAAGAALEYGTELWNCVDMWFMLTFPGHTADEMYNNLKFAYLAGVNRVYVEASTALVEDDSNGGKRLNDIGRNFVKFAGEYKDRERDYTVRDYRPETGIIRYDDTFWGQNLVWDKGLFGNKKIRPDARSREWLKIINLLTFGESKPHTLTWSRIAPSSLGKHRSFVSMNSLAVFDDRVKKETLSSLKLAFLCGVRISPETLKAVGELVKENGLTVVAPKRYAPAEFADKVEGAYTEIKDGAGCWIITDGFSSKKLRDRIAPFMGNKGEIRLTFKDREVKMKISDNGETFTEI